MAIIMESKENKPNLSRKELLAEYRLSKLKKDEKTEVKTIKKKVSSAARSTIAFSTTRTSIIYQNHGVKMTERSNSGKNLLGAHHSAALPCAKVAKSQKIKHRVVGANVADIFEKLQEAELLAKSSDISVVRSFIQNIPQVEGFEHIHSKAIYWLTWIKLESNAHEWEAVEQLFARANGLVSSASDRSAISAAYESFKVQANVVLAAKVEAISNIDTPDNSEGDSSPAQDRSLLGDLLGYEDEEDAMSESGKYSALIKPMNAF